MKCRGDGTENDSGDGDAQRLSATIPACPPPDIRMLTLASSSPCMPLKPQASVFPRSFRAKIPVRPPRSNFRCNGIVPHGDRRVTMSRGGLQPRLSYRRGPERASGQHLRTDATSAATCRRRASAGSDSLPPCTAPSPGSFGFYGIRLVALFSGVISRMSSRTAPHRKAAALSPERSRICGVRHSFPPGTLSEQIHDR